MPEEVVHCVWVGLWQGVLTSPSVRLLRSTRFPSLSICSSLTAFSGSPHSDRMVWCCPTSPGLMTGATNISPGSIPESPLFGPSSSDSSCPHEVLPSSNLALLAGRVRLFCSFIAVLLLLLLVSSKTSSSLKPSVSSINVAAL